MQKPDKRNRRLVQNLHIGFAVFEVKFKLVMTMSHFVYNSSKHKVMMFSFSIWSFPSFALPLASQCLQGAWRGKLNFTTLSNLNAQSNQINLTIEIPVHYSHQYKEATGKFPASFFRRHPAVQSQLINSREVMKLLYLKPGDYVIVPSTFNPNETASFIITVLSKVEAHLQ